jgi:phage shock protein A
MTIYSKLRLLMRAKAEEPVRQLVDRNDIQIFEQEIRETHALVSQSKMHLASIKADIKLLHDSINAQKAGIERREKQTLEAIEKDENLAHDLAAHIAETENDITDMEARLSQLRAAEARVTNDLKQAVRIIKNHQQHLVILKANETRTHASIKFGKGSNGLTTCISDLNESLRSIQQRQLRNQTLDAEMLNVDQSINGNNLDERVKSAGIRSGEHDAVAVLERLKQRVN